ncbi:MAG: GGDEF domain-containing protein [Chloroflexi bacterium]|nr:MAG: GGDEF domain-containing protein [Chloroflexota bacterium]MBL1194131.1 GGDEF domain-containing protein [Chloroflexota bacterium]NOH11424.1 GGDEF domain-containing protein [Chloroflexota bacterium]
MNILIISNDKERQAAIQEALSSTDLETHHSEDLEAVSSSKAQWLLVDLHSDAGKSLLSGQMISDSLTGLMNRRAFYDRGSAEIQRAIRDIEPLSLLLFDIDSFKATNDKHGNLVGDQVLEAVADTMRNTIRPYDLLARWVGDQFICIFPDTEQDVAEQIGMRLKEKIDSLTLTTDKDESVSIKINVGISALPEDSTLGLDALVRQAEEAMNNSKNGA